METPAFVVRFRGAGWRYPLAAGDAIEVWQNQDCVGEVPATLVLLVLNHYVQGAQLTEQMRRALSVSPPPEPRRLPPPPSGPRLLGARGRPLRGRKTSSRVP
jgi:hypothetical protein